MGDGLAKGTLALSTERALEELSVPPPYHGGAGPPGQRTPSTASRRTTLEELGYVMEDGDRVAGILTSTDALETIAGELRDPFIR